MHDPASDRSKRLAQHSGVLVHLSWWVQNCSCRGVSDRALNFTLLVWTREPRRPCKIVSVRNFRSEPLLHERGTPSERALNEVSQQCSTG